MALTFVHTADWHLGRRYERIGRYATSSYGWRFEAVRRIYEVAVHRHAQFILAAGDILDREHLPRTSMEEFLTLLGDAPVPLVLIPGNHDPYREGCAWGRDEVLQCLRGFRQVHLCLEPVPLELPGIPATIFPCPVRTKNTPEDVTAWIPRMEPGGDRYRIGLAHGRWKGYAGQPFYENPIASDRAIRAGLDSLALGDFHSPTPPDHPAATARCYYSGAPECTARDEADPGHALLVHIEAPGAIPMVERIFVGHVRLRVLPRITFSPGGDLAPLEEALAGIPDLSQSLVALDLAGALTPEEHAALADRLATLRGESLGIDLVDEDLVEEPTAVAFDELGLTGAEAQLLAHLRTADLAEVLGRSDHAELLATWWTDPGIRREAVSRYYRALREATA